MAVARKFEVEITVPEGCKAGDTFKVIVEAPEVTRKERGSLSGISLAEMTDEQVRRELVNAKSVLYKAQKKEAALEIIEAAEARVNAALAEKNSRASMMSTGTGVIPSGSVIGSSVADANGPVDEDMAEEI